MARNLEYEHGYRHGYELAQFYGLEDPKRNIRSRGISLRSVYAVGFLCGHRDRKNGLPCKY